MKKMFREAKIQSFGGYKEINDANLKNSLLARTRFIPTTC